MQMLVNSIRTGFFYIGTELNAKFGKLLDKFLVIILIGNVAICLVLVKRLRIIKLVVSIIGVLAFCSSGQSVERCHHTDATNLVFRIHVITFVTKRSEVHTSRSAKAINQGYNLLTL